tara:strand:- start:924 stop:1115 length:192 start_codon:yes stop_codon:yes gene_type:complete
MNKNNDATIRKTDNTYSDLLFWILNSGAIAQLGERLHGMQEVGGSIPPSSTKIRILIINLGGK